MKLRNHDGPEVVIIEKPGILRLTFPPKRRIPITQCSNVISQKNGNQSYTAAKALNLVHDSSRRYCHFLLSFIPPCDCLSLLRLSVVFSRSFRNTVGFNRYIRHMTS